MSFGGHALDMIRRLKDSRNSIELSRKKRRESLKKMVKSGSTSDTPNVTLEDLERMDADNKLYEKAREKRTTKLIFVALGIIAFSAVLVWIAFKKWLL